MESKILKESEHLDVYKWIKIGQAVILMILGILFVMTALLNKDSEEGIGLMLSISVGIILAVYGILDIISGYFLYRNPYNADVIIGEVFLALATVLFIKRDIINEVLSYFVSILVIIIALILVLHGILHITGKGNQKSVVKGVISFVVAGALLALGIVYLVMYLTSKQTVEIYMLLILGVVLFILGVAALSIMVIKIRNTNRMLKEQKIKEINEFKTNTNDVPTNTTVKIIDINELKKTKKLNNSKKDTATSIIVVEDDNSENTSNEEVNNDTL